MKKNTFIRIVSTVFFVGASANALAVSDKDTVPAGSTGDESGFLAHLVETSGITCGLCSVVGGEDTDLALRLARSGRFFVHVLDPQPSVVAEARKVVDVDGLYGKRVVVEQGSPQQLIFADNTVDLVIASRLTRRELTKQFVTEIVRVLRPEGVAILIRSAQIGDSAESVTADDFRSWLKSSAGVEFEVFEKDSKVWAQVTKTPLEGVDEWTHWEHGPDNNPVSTDMVIKAPYTTQFLARPYYITMPAISTVAGGRVFLAMGHIAHHEREEPWLNTLMARNGYNGTILWTRKLPDGYIVHRSAFIANKDVFYMIDTDGRGLLLLDPKTGEDRQRIDVPGVQGEWKWIAKQDGIIYALVGEEKDEPQTTVVRSPFSHWSWGELSKAYYERPFRLGLGTTILAYDLAMDKPLWIHKEDSPVDSRAMVVGGGQVFFYGPQSHIGCLDAGTGELLWTNGDPKTRELIEELPKRGLKSTPGFRTSCFCLYTPKALFYEAQTRANIVAVSNKDGKLLWHRSKTTNNPNMLYVDDHLFVGIGEPNGNTLKLDPATGKTIEDLNFAKRSCARLTATPDSLFCRGPNEGLIRYDRNEKNLIFNAAFRPACNDGIIGANGMLYVEPWLCDCNLALMGTIGLCSAGDFKFDQQAKDQERLQPGEGDILHVQAFDVSERDWATYRGNTARNASTSVPVPGEVGKLWEYKAPTGNQLTGATVAGGLVFIGSDDGKVRAIEATSGKLKWSFPTAGPIMHPPTIWNGRAYVGSGDGYIYALEAASGRLLWRFRAAPVERRIMVYGSLCSTWPVNTGVLVEDGVAYAAAGIIDYDGTYIYALDAVSGKIKWQNNTSGHLHSAYRKGVSAHGDLTIAGGRLWMAAGNVVSPAVYDLKTGEYVGGSAGNGTPGANRGEEIAVINDKYILLGGRLQYSATENVVDPGDFITIEIKSENEIGAPKPLNQGKIPPAWNTDGIVFVHGRNSEPAYYEISTIEKHLEQMNPKQLRRMRRLPDHLWVAKGFEESDTVSLAIAKNAVLAVYGKLRPRHLSTMWRVCCLKPQDGTVIWQKDLPSAALPGGLSIDRDGQVIVVMENGGVACFGEAKSTASAR